MVTSSNDERTSAGTTAEDAQELGRMTRENILLHRAHWDGRIFVKGEGCEITDIEGNTYLDARAGFTVVTAGFGREQIADAVEEQASNINYAPVGSISIPNIKLAAKLAELTPGDLTRPLFGTGGSDSNETALKMAKSYHGRNGHKHRYKFITRRGSYHGATASLMGAIPGRSAEYEPLPPGSIQVTAPDCYNCPLGKNPKTCGTECAKEIDTAITWQGPESVAAVLGEPVGHSSGASIPPADYWPMVREICDKHGVLLIADEVVNGFGRTGKMFACEHFGLEPDIMTVAKGLVSGYVPISAAIASKKIADTFVGDGIENLNHVFSFGGLPVACAAALANIGVIEEENLVENARVVGEYFLEKMEKLYKHKIVGDIRGIGLEIGAVLVKDRDTREPIDLSDGFDARFSENCRERGVMCGMLANSIGITPPLCITKDEADRVVDVIDEVLTEMT